MNAIIFILLISTSFATCSEKKWTDEEETPEYWYNEAREELQIALEQQRLNQNVAKNIIIFLGDGMSIPTITAGRILKGQLQNKSGEETMLAMDQFHHVGLSKTYAVNKQVADSASTATAYLCGVKSTYSTIGLSAKVRNKECKTEKGNKVDSVLVDAYKAGPQKRCSTDDVMLQKRLYRPCFAMENVVGIAEASFDIMFVAKVICRSYAAKSTGIVTTTRITHATPAGAYAHTASRNWYADDDLPADAVANGCKDIAQQFYDNSHMITVALGGGRKYFHSNSTRDPEYIRDFGNRLDGKDLISMWQEDQKKRGLNAKYVWNKEQFDSVYPPTTDNLLGMFEPSDMKYEVDRASDNAGEPSIDEMTEKAIQILQKNSNGYFLLVEGGRIDHAHHSSNAHRALHDAVAFDNAIARAVEMTSDSDTLIIVTADHSHTFSMGGYSERGNPILGLVTSDGKHSQALDKKPYTSLLYANGPGYLGPLPDAIDPHSRRNLTDVATGNKNQLQQTAVPLPTETHGGDDVAIFSRGPMSHLFHGVHEQNYIAYVMRYAACIGSNLDHCVIKPSESKTSEVVTKNVFLGMSLGKTQTEVALYVQFALLFCLLILLLVLCILTRIKRSSSKIVHKSERLYL